jgi:hypothetical protein
VENQMKARTLAAISTLVLAACGGGGGGGSSAPGAPGAPAPPLVPAATGTIPMALSFPRKSPSSAQHRPQFVSPNAAAVAVYDGSTLVYVANVSFDSQTQFQTVYAKSAPPTSIAPGTCTFTNATATCTITVTTTIGAHKFDVLMYPVMQGTQQGTSTERKPQDTGTPPAFTGVISSEGELSVNLSAGANPGQTMTLLGVADQVLYAGLSEAAYNATVTYGFRIEDSTNAQIVQPGTAYDNGPVTITAAPSGIVTITPSSFSTPPASLGDQNFGVQCINGAGGTVTITFNAQTHPNTAYASGLTYSTSNYSGATIASIPFTCDAASATIPITVDGARQR